MSERGMRCGERIAWTLVSYGKTDGLSSVHRVLKTDVTFCGEEIPPEIRRFPALRSLNICPACEGRYWNSARLSA